MHIGGGGKSGTKRDFFFNHLSSPIEMFNAKTKASRVYKKSPNMSLSERLIVRFHNISVKKTIKTYF